MRRRIHRTRLISLMYVNDLPRTNFHALVIKLSQLLLLKSLRILSINSHSVGMKLRTQLLVFMILTFHFADVLLDSTFLVFGKFWEIDVRVAVLVLYFAQNCQTVLCKGFGEFGWCLLQWSISPFRDCIKFIFFQNLLNLSLQQPLCWLIPFILLQWLVWHLWKQRSFTLVFTCCHIKNFRCTFDSRYLINYVFKLVYFFKVLSVECCKFSLNSVD